jgi:hypothetical protein
MKRRSASRTMVLGMFVMLALGMSHAQIGGDVLKLKVPFDACNRVGHCDLQHCQWRPVCKLDHHAQSNDKHRSSAHRGKSLLLRTRWQANLHWAVLQYIPS